MTYQPLLAEAAAGNLETRQVVVPQRGVLRRTLVIKAAALALLFPREAVSPDVLEHPRQDFQAALRVIASGPPRQTPFPVKQEKEDDHHAYHR